MLFTRRKFITLSGLAAAAALLAACSSEQTTLPDLLAPSSPPAVPPIKAEALRPALNRLTFAPHAEELDHAAAIGLDNWIEEQLAPQSLDDTSADLRLRGVDTISLDSSLLFDVREENARRDLQRAALLRAVYSRRQLYEVMVDFWSDHFNVSTLKGQGPWLKIIDDRETIRPHALGNFGELLWATMHSPAMLVYLDNQDNRSGYPNENYARELMELHTLGVDGGYSQRDVQEVARCLTGWSVSAGLFPGRFNFDATTHDDNAKQPLGHSLAAGGGGGDGQRVFELLLAHPALPQFIARKLARRFVADDPSPRLVQEAAATFTASSGDIKQTLRVILHAPEFAQPALRLARPFNYVAGALRQLGASTAADSGVLQALSNMGQPLFERLTPDGYPVDSASWAGNWLPRWQFALDLASGDLDNIQLDLPKLAGQWGVATVPAALDSFARLLIGAPLPTAANQQIAQLIGPNLDEDSLRMIVAVLLAAPQYHWR